MSIDTFDDIDECRRCRQFRQFVDSFDGSMVRYFQCFSILSIVSILSMVSIVWMVSMIYVMIYEDEKIECEKWRATVTATLVTATIPGTIQTLMTGSMVTVFRVAVMIGNHLLASPFCCPKALHIS